MKIGKKSSKSSVKPSKNYNKKNLAIGAIVAITVVLIIWVYTMGQKAEQTISVVMMNESAYKNQVITESMLKEYKMLKGEFEKYAIVNEDGTRKKRLILWDERNMILNAFAAYPLQKDTVLELRSVVKSRTDNSDTVLYSYPGKNIVTLSVGDNELQAFKTFLQPGDRINITAVFKEQERVYEESGVGGTNVQTVETIREESVFKDIMVADLLNQNGDSILDIYADYNERTVWEQSNLDASEAFQESVTPQSLLVALTPEEEKTYYKYLSKSEISFKVSLPQRTE